MYSVKITDLMPLTQQIRDACTKIEGNFFVASSLLQFCETLIFVLQIMENILKMLFE